MMIETVRREDRLRANIIQPIIRTSLIGSAIAAVIAAASPAGAQQQGCLTTRGLVMTANVGPVAVSGHFATVLQHGNWDTRPTVRFAKLDHDGAVEVGVWKAVWSVADVELRASTAFVAADDRLIAIDIGDPAAPIELDHVDLVNAERVSISGSRAYVLSTGMDGNPHLDIVEISQPAEMERRGSTSWGPDDPEPRAIDADRGFVAVADEDGIVVIDARDPWNPIRGGRWSGTGIDDIALIDRLAVVAGDVEGAPPRRGIRVVDLTQPARLTERGFWQAPSRVTSVDVFGEQVAVATEGHGVFVIDLEHPDAPAAIDQWDGIGRGAVALAAAWPNLAVANDQVGLIVLGLKAECMPPRQASGRTKP
jgi:hypothetical protein